MSHRRLFQSDRNRAPSTTTVQSRSGNGPLRVVYIADAIEIDVKQATYYRVPVWMIVL